VDSNQGHTTTQATKQQIKSTSKMASLKDLQSGEPMESTLKSDGESTETFDVKTPEGDEPEQPATAAGTDQQAQDEDEETFDVKKPEEPASAGDKQEEGNGDDPPKSLCRRIWNRWWEFYYNNDFVIMIVIAILLAKAYPPLGADYLQPQITSTWIAVIFIFGTY
jgi:hypothetical protein